MTCKSPPHVKGPQYKTVKEGKSTDNKDVYVETSLLNGGENHNLSHRISQLLFINSKQPVITDSNNHSRIKLLTLLLATTLLQDESKQ